MGAAISSFSYTYDNVSKPTDVDEHSGDTVHWDYYADNRLKNAKRTGGNAYNITSTYDPAGNRQTKTAGGAVTTYAYNGANELETSEATAGTTTYTYDGAGNQTTAKTPASAVTTNTWNDESLRTLVKQPDGTLIATSYDGDGQIYEQQSVKIVHNKGGRLMEFNADGTPCCRWCPNGRWALKNTV